LGAVHLAGYKTQQKEAIMSKLQIKTRDTQVAEELKLLMREGERDEAMELLNLAYELGIEVFMASVLAGHPAVKVRRRRKSKVASRRTREQARRAAVRKIEAQPTTNPFDALDDLDAKIQAKALRARAKIQAEALRRRARHLAREGEGTKARLLSELAMEIGDTGAPMKPAQLRATLY
jgi:hypothetical protein